MRHRAELPAERFVVAGPRPGGPRTRGARRDPRGRCRHPAAEQPRRLDRHHPRRAGRQGRPARHARPRGRRLTAGRRPTGPWTRRRVPAHHRSRRDERRCRRALLRLPRRLARRRGRPDAGRGPSRGGPSSAPDDLRGRGGRDGRRRAGPRPASCGRSEHRRDGAHHDHAADRHTRGPRGRRPGRRRAGRARPRRGASGRRRRPRRLEQGRVQGPRPRHARPRQGPVVRGETEYVVAERSVGAGSRASCEPRRVRSWRRPAWTAPTRESAAGGCSSPTTPTGSASSSTTPCVARHGVRLGVVLSDTAGRAWRVGQIDFALGAHGSACRRRPARGHRCRRQAARGDDARGRRRDRSGGRPGQGQGGGGAGRGPPRRPGGPRRRAPREAPTRTRPRAHRARRLVRLRPGRGRAGGAGHRTGQPVGGGSRRGAGRRRQPPRRGVAGGARRVARCRGGTADVGRLSVTLGADSPYELGQLVSRLCTALWCEWLVGAAESPSADGLSVVVRISGAHSS